MFPTKSILIIFYCLFLLSINGRCQLVIDCSSNLFNNDLITLGNDSINKKLPKIKLSDDFLSGKEDAREYYSNNKVFAITFFSSLIVPPAGFITTIALSTIKPKTRTLNLPNQKLVLNDQYMKGYMQKASRMKAGKAWIGCLSGISFFCIGYLMFYGI
jgi:hypothetical protein